MLHGTDAENFEHIDINNIDIEAVDEAASKFIKQLDTMSEEELLGTWRKKGFYVAQGMAEGRASYVMAIKRTTDYGADDDDDIRVLGIGNS
ncbi:hypothetical protein VTO58DRAFT_102999 [Aureobasidium pullulans]